MTTQRSQISIENPTLELKIISASDVGHLDATDKMDVYAVVSIYGDNSEKKQAAKTPIDYDGGSNPTWNHTVKLSINEREANEGLMNITVKLYSYWLEGDNDLYLGEVNVSVQELLASNPIPPFANGNVNKMRFVAYPVKFIGETKPNTKLSLSYRFKPVPVDEHAPDCLPKLGQPIYPNTDPTRSGQSLVFPPQFQIPTGKLTLELVIKFAKDIKDVNSFSAMDVYASVAILKDTQVLKKRMNTPIAVSANKNPKWNHGIEFILDEMLAREGRLSLLIELRSHRPFLGDKDIGKVKLSIQELLASHPPSPLSNDDANSMKLEMHALTGSYGKKGSVIFTYRFLTEQVTVPLPSSASQPYIMYIPASHQSGANAGPSNGQVPIYMAPPYQLHGYQQYALQHPQSQPPHCQPQPDRQSPPPPPLQQATHLLHEHAQGPRPNVKPQGVSIGAIGLGAAAFGRAIGEALISDMVSDEVNLYNFEA